MTIAPGWVRDERGVLKRETNHHWGRRLSGFDYGQRRIYEITIVLEERLPILGRLEKQGERWVVNPTQFGEVVLSCWREIPKRWAAVELIEGCLMPDHFHGIVFVKEQLPKGYTLGSIIGGFKAGCTIGWRALAEISPAYERGQVNKAAGAVPAAKAAGVPRWAEGFVDVILFGKGQLSRMVAYLHDNPRRLAIKRENPLLFRVLRNLRVNLASPAVVPWAGPAFGHFAAIGNHFLLSCHTLCQVQCSRRFFVYARDEKGDLLKNQPPAVKTVEFEEKLASALGAAKSGAVIVSPCISHGEREIARQVFAFGGHVITLQNVGFSPVYKLGGRLFEHCTAGNLLMLAPIAWPYQTNEKPMTRSDAQILNRIAQLIAGEGAIPIDYKGVTLKNIDNLVASALDCA